MKEFPKGGLIGKVMDAANTVKQMHIPLHAAYAAYFIILAFFPALVLILSVLRYTGMEVRGLVELLGDILPSTMVGGQILVLAIELFVDRTISFWLGLSRSLLLQGQVWRAISFIFIPFSGGSILSVVLGIYFTWFIGTALEREWGDFRYTVYLLSGVLGTVLGCLLTGVTASTYCLSLSLLLAFAMLYPEVQLLLFFVIPIRVKYFGVFAAVLWVFSFLGASLPGKLDYLLSMLNVWLFFAPMVYRSLRAWVRREQWKRKNRR